MFAEELSPLSLLNQNVLPPPIAHPSQLSTIANQPKIRYIVREPVITSDCLACIKYVVLGRRRTMISVPQTSEITRTFDGYVKSEVILPIVALINKLRRIPEYPIFEYEVTLIDADDPLAITEVHFFGDFNTDTLEFPVIFFLPSLSLKQDAEDGQFLLPMSASFGRAVNRWRSEGNWIIVTDFSTTVLINAVDEKLQVTAAECEVRPPSPSTVPLRYLLASYIQKTLPRDYLALDTERLTITQGAPNNPHLPLPADEEIFANRHAHSDFDRYALANSQPLVEQFLRWKALMQARPKSVLVGTVLQAKCHGFQQHIPWQHRYPLEPLPEDTLAHLRTVARCSFPKFIQLFNRSQAFSVLLDEELTQPEGTGYARTFTCRIIAVDGQPPPSDDVPRKLCVKLFDDSAAFVPSLEKYAFWWSQNFYTAEDMIRNEIVVYNRLEHARGSVIPHFYGAHSFTLKDGRTVFGILLEYVTPSERKLKEQSEVAQTAFIQSARHALRVLQYADISQHDWSTEQWICTHSPSHTASDPTLTCVLIDFSLTRQGDCCKDGHKEDDYGNMADELYYSGISVDLIRKCFGPREEWDFYLASYVMNTGKEVPTFHQDESEIRGGGADAYVLD